MNMALGKDPEELLTMAKNNPTMAKAALPMAKKTGQVPPEIIKQVEEILEDGNKSDDTSNESNDINVDSVINSDYANDKISKLYADIEKMFYNSLIHKKDGSKIYNNSDFNNTCFFYQDNPAGLTDDFYKEYVERIIDITMPDNFILHLIDTYINKINESLIKDNQPYRVIYHYDQDISEKEKIISKHEYSDLLTIPNEDQNKKMYEEQSIQMIEKSI